VREIAVYHHHPTMPGFSGGASPRAYDFRVLPTAMGGASARAYDFRVYK